MTRRPLTDEMLERARRNNLGYQLEILSDDFNRRVIAQYATIGYADIRTAHGSVLRNLELGGNRLTTLAKRAGVTHRAMAKLVSDVEQLGYIERHADPSDGRASLICYTARP